MHLPPPDGIAAPARASEAACNPMRLNRWFPRCHLGVLLLPLACLTSTGSTDSFRIEQQVITTSQGAYYWSQSRAAVIPGPVPRVILTTQEIERAGSHGYRDIYLLETNDRGRTWSGPTLIPSLQRARQPDGYDFVMGDVCPLFHARTGVVLATGKTFGFREGRFEDRTRERVSYAVFSPQSSQWSVLRLLALPEVDRAGHPFLAANAGCNQRYDAPDGTVLLPIRYQRDPKVPQYTTIVARCTFDGETLRYVTHGSELTLGRDRGLYEPSITRFGDRYFLSLRADHSSFVARSTDGLNFEPIVEWTFDDGRPLGSYNTQQHWISRPDALYLVYTRRAGTNDHVFRHRAPLFIAQVDPETLRVRRKTERILVREEGADLGAGFGVVDLAPNETWVVTSEIQPQSKSMPLSNRILLARIHWAAP
ncbi:MAG: exo-alpha-sialidase [Opitutaceae bacterium]|nr:exo-alpha-sialidase [Opitutaceae bacterium]